VGNESSRSYRAKSVGPVAGQHGFENSRCENAELQLPKFQEAGLHIGKKHSSLEKAWKVLDRGY